MNIILNGTYEPLDKDSMMIIQWLLTEPRGEEEEEEEENSNQYQNYNLVLDSDINSS